MVDGTWYIFIMIHTHNRKTPDLFAVSEDPVRYQVPVTVVVSLTSTGG